MVTEDYVSYETAKLLKEKGFDEPCYAYWHEDENRLIFSYSMHAIRNATNPCFFGPAAPTIQMAMKWLREKYDLHIEITSVKPYGSDGNGHDIPLDGVEYHSNIVQNNKWTDIIKKFKSHSITCYYSYEQACEAAIIYCLENLI